VLDFSDLSFAEFFATELDVDIQEKYVLGIGARLP
jgi:hypothetical protein